MAGEELVIAVIVTAAVAVFCTAFYKARYRVVPEGEVMVVFGVPRGDRAWIAIGPGGGRFIKPITEAVKFLKLELPRSNPAVRSAPTKKAIPMWFDFSVQARISLERAKLDRAVMEFMNQTPEQATKWVDGEVEEAARKVCGRMELESIISNIDGFGGQVREMVEPRLAERGLEFVHFVVKEFGDQVGYIEALRLRAATLQKDADAKTEEYTKVFANDPVRKARFKAIVDRVSIMSDEESARLLAQLEAAPLGSLPPSKKAIEVKADPTTGPATP